MRGMNMVSHYQIVANTEKSKKQFSAESDKQFRSLKSFIIINSGHFNSTFTLQNNSV